MKNKTLADRVSKDFSRVRLKKISVNVPKLKNTKKLEEAKKHASHVFLSNIKDDKIPISSIVNIMIKSAVEKAKNAKKQALPVFSPDSADKFYAVLKDDKELIANGGYGTVSKNYGTAPHTSYVDYGKIFAYLGKFKSQSAYENMGNPVDFINKSLGDQGFSLVDSHTMERGTNYIRYFHSKTPIDKSSLVPMAGMNSAEWEQFKMFMRLDTALYLLKISTS